LSCKSFCNTFIQTNGNFSIDTSLRTYLQDRGRFFFSIY